MDRLLRLDRLFMDRLRRLDALFAEKVLGLEVVERRQFNRLTDEWSVEPGITDDVIPRQLPQYTRSLDAAWEGALKFDGFVLRLISKRTPGNDNHYIAQVWTGKNKWDGSGGHPSEALVLACLSALGYEEFEGFSVTEEELNC